MHHHKKGFSFAHLTKEIGHDLGTGTKEVFHLGSKVIQEPSKIINNGLDKAGNVFEGLGLPLLIVGGIVLVAYMNNQK